MAKRPPLQPAGYSIEPAEFPQHRRLGHHNYREKNTGSGWHQCRFRLPRRRISRVLVLDCFPEPGALVFEECQQQCVVQPMATATATNGRNDRRACKIQVSDAIENFVADKLVAVSQAFLIEDLTFRQHNRIIERATARQPCGTQCFYFMQETENLQKRGKLDS